MTVIIHWQVVKVVVHLEVEYSTKVEIGEFIGGRPWA